MSVNEQYSKFKPLIFVSGIYLLLIIIFSIGDISEFKTMPPNAWGDFLAGTFAPLAFMWLVFGYRQQGEELKQNTKALRLQADELKSNVEQQKVLVETAKEELASIQNKDNRQIQLETIQAQPFFHFDNMTISSVPDNPDGTSMGILKFECFIKNSRCTCREICISTANPNRSVVISTKFDLLENLLNSELKLSLYLPYKDEYEQGNSFSVDLEIQYLDAYDIQQFQIIELSVDRDYVFEELAFKFYTKRKNRSF